MGHAWCVVSSFTGLEFDDLTLAFFAVVRTIESDSQLHPQTAISVFALCQPLSLRGRTEFGW